MPSHENFSLDEYNKYLGTQHLGKFWKKVSGTGTVTVVNQGFQFSGVQVWELDTFIETVNGWNGIYANFIHQQTAGASTVTIGVDCYNASKSFLGNRACFFSGSAPAVATSVYTYAMNQGAAATNFVAGTVYAKVKIAITANNGIYNVTMPLFNTMPYSSKALYA